LTGLPPEIRPQNRKTFFWILEGSKPGMVLDFNRDIRRWGRDSEFVQASWSISYSKTKTYRLAFLLGGLEPAFRVPFSTIFHGIALEKR
jgi:hypothetical protein